MFSHEKLTDKEFKNFIKLNRRVTLPTNHYEALLKEKRMKFSDLYSDVNKLVSICKPLNYQLPEITRH